MVIATRRRREQPHKGRSVVLGVCIFAVLLWAGIALAGRKIQSPLALRGSSPILVLELQLDPPVRIRMQLHDQQAPQAAAYITRLAKESSCTKCTLYRGEPVPDYWGSPDKPDRYFDGGRWGPPYALVQGGLVSNVLEQPPPEPHRPIIERGMVAWAGGKGGVHFFVALANHPEWEHGHTVWATVLPDDMPYLDALVVERPLQTTRPKRPPIVSNFVDPIPFTVSQNV